MFCKPYAKLYDLFNMEKPYKKEVGFVYKWGKRPKSILDIGCGTAIYWKYYPKHVHLFGVDKSQSMIDTSFMREIIRGDITKLKIDSSFDCATALFDVINYIPKHDWWKNLPIKKGGYFIFDIWDKEKVDRDGFRETFKEISGIKRTISPSKIYLGTALELDDDYDGRRVNLNVNFCDGFKWFSERHTMYVHSHEDILRFCGKEFEIVDVKPTKTWQTWYKLRRK